MELADIRLFICVFYEGPWERLGQWLLAIDPDAGEIRREVKPGSLRDRLADWCDHRDSAWRARWALRYPQKPGPRWKRRGAKPAAHP